MLLGLGLAEVELAELGVGVEAVGVRPPLAAQPPRAAPAIRTESPPRIAHLPIVILFAVRDARPTVAGIPASEESRQILSPARKRYADRMARFTACPDQTLSGFLTHRQDISIGVLEPGAFDALNLSDAVHGLQTRHVVLLEDHPTPT